MRGERKGLCVGRCERKGVMLCGEVVRGMGVCVEG